MAEVLLGIVIENLGSCVQKQLASYWSVDQQTQKLSGNLTAICAVLRDAEKKQITSKVLKNWLQKLTDAAYVLDDILDECSLQSKKVNSNVGQSSCLARVNEERSMFELRDGVTEKQALHDDDDWRQTSTADIASNINNNKNRHK